MRTHSGLHLLAGVVFRDYGALVTGGNMEPLEARMDFNLPEVPEGFKDAIAAACAVEIAADRRIDVQSCRATRRSRSPTSSGPRPTCCRPA